MRNPYAKVAWIFVVIGIFAIPAFPAGAEGFFTDTYHQLTDQFSEGRWRAEFSGTAVYTNRNGEERSGDSLYTGSIDYTWPVNTRATLGIRAYPLFVYNQREPNETIVGAGAGLAARIYKDKDTYQGWYLEGAISLIGHYPKFSGNTGSANLLSEAGVGYQYSENWHVTLKWRHLSNAGIASENTGVNGVALAVGYTF